MAKINKHTETNDVIYRRAKTEFIAKNPTQSYTVQCACTVVHCMLLTVHYKTVHFALQVSVPVVW